MLTEHTLLISARCICICSRRYRAGNATQKQHSDSILTCLVAFRCSNSRDAHAHEIERQAAALPPGTRPAAACFAFALTLRLQPRAAIGERRRYRGELPPEVPDEHDFLNQLCVQAGDEET